MIELRTPGVYIQEIPSGVRAIAAVSTSNTAFVGSFSQGPVNRAIRINSYGDFERTFGGLHSDSVTSYAIQQYFLNGGSVAYVVRVADIGATAINASAPLNDNADTEVFTLRAENPGVWGNRIQYQIEHAPAPNPNSEFTLTVRLMDNLAARRPNALVTETHRNLTVANAIDSIAEDSTLVRLNPPGAANTNLPDPTLGFENLVAVSGTLANGGTDVFVVNALNNTSAGEDLSVSVEAVAAPSFTVRVHNDGDTITYETFTDLTLETATTVVNRDSSRISLTRIDPAGVTLPAVATTALALAAGAARGVDGNLPTAAQLEGSSADPNNRTGMHALEGIAPEVFNLMSIPSAPDLGDAGAQALYAAANAFCIDQRAFLIIDQPEGEDSPADALSWGPLATLRSDHAAIFYPRILVPDPLNSNRLRNLPNSGTMAGLFARTDSQRGVWKAPAGTDLPLRNVSLASNMTDAENGELNPFGINGLRSLPIYGNVSWGSRTLFGENARAHEYGYVPVRRTALFIEESLFQGLQWVVFEPNDERLWSQIRVNVTSFMQGLFRQGAFAGVSPREAYLVKCDSETTTPTDVNLGIVNILVGFAPLKPAEFVVISIQQLTQQSEL